MKRRLRTAILLPAVLGAAIAAGGAEPAGPRPVNVILIVVDALGAGHLGTYGYSRATDPRLAGLAAKGAMFTDVIAASNWTLPGLASIMTGLSPAVHGAQIPATEPRWPRRLEAGTLRPRAGEALDPSRPTLAAILTRHGYRTMGIVSGAYCRSAFGFGQGFGEYHESGGRMEELSQVYLPWIERNRDRRFFLYIHVGDVHAPYRAPAPYAALWDPNYSGSQAGSNEALDALEAQIAGGRMPAARDIEHLRALYDGGVAYTDKHIGRLLDRLKALHLDGKTAVMVTADHGEGFLEHGLMRHGNSFYDELLRVPLVVDLPGFEGGRRIGGLARSIDIMPTILDYLRLPLPPMQGRSLIPWLRGGTPDDRPAISEGRFGAAVHDGRWKLIRWTGPDQLYDLAADPGERKNIAAGRPDQRARLAGLLDSSRAEEARAAGKLPPLSGSASVLDAKLREKLRAGGYLK